MELQFNGFSFIEFTAMSEEELPARQMLAGSYAAVLSNGKFLMVFNKWRSQWEVPAGKREGAETPKECAIRELWEETGQSFTDMELLGLMTSKETETGKLKYNPVYFASAENLQPFQDNEETMAILLWDGKDKIGVIDGVDSKLIQILNEKIPLSQDASDEKK